MLPLPYSRPLALAFILLLGSCAPALTPQPAPVLTFERLNRAEVRLSLTPSPRQGVRWSVQPSEECGGEDGPVLHWGDWPENLAVISIPAQMGDLVRVTFPGSPTQAECP